MTTLIPAISNIGDATKARMVMYANGQLVQAPLNPVVDASLMALSGASTAGYLLQTNGTGTVPSWVGFLQSGTGATTRTWQDKDRERISVKDFGAVGNGSTNDTTALTNALASGREVFLPPGNYLINPSTFSGFTNLRIRGAGRDVTKITLNSTGTALTFSNCQWLQASDLSIQASGAAQSLANAIGIQLDTGSNNCVIERCNFYGFSLDGLRLVGTSLNTLSGNVVRQCYFLGCGRNQIYGFYNNDFTIDNCQYGILGAAAHASFGCYLENCSQGEYTKNKHWNNVVGFKSVTCAANRVFGNRFELSDQQGAYFTGGNSNVFIGNVVHTNSQTSNGTYDNLYATSEANLIVEGNRVYSWNSTYSKWGINLDSGCTLPIVKGNSIDGFDVTNFGPIRFDGSITSVSGDLVINTTSINAAAASTLYLSNGAETVEGAAYRPLNQRYAVARIYYATNAAPGAGQTFTYTLRKNGADSAHTATSSGAASFAAAANNTAPQIVLAAGDFISSKLVTSATATVTNHRSYVVLVGY